MDTKTSGGSINNPSSTKESIPEDKIVRLKGVWKKTSDMTTEDKENIKKANTRFSMNHRGEAIVTAKLKEKYCCKNKESNTLKIMQTIHKERLMVKKITPRSFNTADIVFHNVYEANKSIDRYSVMREEIKMVDLSIISSNTRSKGLIKDWDRDMSLMELAEAIDDNRGIISLQRMVLRKFNKSEKKTGMVFQQ